MYLMAQSLPLNRTIFFFHLRIYSLWCWARCQCPKLTEFNNHPWETGVWLLVSLVYILHTANGKGLKRFRYFFRRFVKCSRTKSPTVVEGPLSINSLKMWFVSEAISGIPPCSIDLKNERRRSDRLLQSPESFSPVIPLILEMASTRSHGRCETWV